MLYLKKCKQLVILSSENEKDTCRKKKMRMILIEGEKNELRKNNFNREKFQIKYILEIMFSSNFHLYIHVFYLIVLCCDHIS